MRELVDPSFNLFGLRRIPFPRQLDSGLQFAQSDCRKEERLVSNAVQPGKDTAVRLALPELRESIGIKQIHGLGEFHRPPPLELASRGNEAFKAGLGCKQQLL